MIKRLAATFIMLAAGAPAIAAAPSVRVETGLLHGVAGDQVRTFLGVPYAAPPVGPLRWRAPASVASWTGMRDATRPGASCPQVATSPTQLSPVGPMAEDCLYLNIHAPADGANGRPVMLWLHGGGFIAGSGSEAQFDGAALARRGIVLVTVNYRIGRLGFFAHPALEAEQGGEARGNYGLMDQIAALRWVKRNIAAFGGDPDNITLFGQSAGGISTLLIGATPETHGLFRKAIILSGTTLQRPRDLKLDHPGQPSALSLGSRWATAATGAAQPSAAMLRALPIEAIAPAAPAMKEVMDLLAAAGPIADGRLVARDPWAAFAANGFPVPLIVGSTGRDALVWSFANDGAQTFPFWSPKPEQIAADPAVQTEILRRYTDAAKGDAKAAQAALAADALFGAGAYHLAGLTARHRPAWLYRFDQVPAPARGLIDGAPHGTELFYAFGTLPRFPFAGDRMDAADRTISEAMLDHFASFARSGAPEARPRWTRFDPAHPQYLLFGAGNPHMQAVDDPASLAAIAGGR